MDYFSLCMDALNLAGQGMMHIYFAGRLTRKKQKLWYFAVYILLLCALQFISVRLALDDSLSIAVGMLELYAVSRFGMGNQQGVSWLAAVLAFYVSQLSFGIINSIEAALYPYFIGNPLLYPLLLAAQGIFFGLCIGCYHAVLKLLAWIEDSQPPYIGLLLFPGLFIFAAELYILHTAYSFFAPVISLEEVGKHSTLLLLQAMGLAALLCT
ncbi:MAG: GHKL domain-containing protein, partial [Oscillospiraceae bacterium]|nr:GHKL domain-containing protein [Oscillospiraceae bacterium]